MPIIEGARSRPLSKAGAPVDGDFAGATTPGQTCADTTTGTLYINTGTTSAPVWSVVGDQTAGGA
ncbi:hypothetical protein ACF07Q_28620 [Nocardiopsis dassonvillei]|uniref:hypothetical protein n=1 Tax=Nocardiopsis dassonvillei TaxID=2014 RepID=UPI0036FA1441